MKISEARRQYDAHLDLYLSSGSRTLYNSRLDIVLHEIGASEVGDVTLPAVRAYLQKTRAQRAASTLNTDIRILGAFLSWLKLPEHPLKGLRSLPITEDPRRRALQEPEIKRLISIPPRALFWEFLVSTGLRRSEFIALRRKDVDLGAKVVHVRPSTVKRNKGREIPLLPALSQKLDGYFNGTPSDQAAFLNGRGRPWNNNLLRSLKVDVRKCEIEEQGVDLHSLRKTFATRLIHRGADPKTVQHLMGHSSIKMTMEIYSEYRAQTSEDTLRAMEMPQ